MQREYLKEIYININAGKIYGTYESYGFNWVLCLSNNNFINWRYYGQSANKNTLKDLEWIIKTIFETTPEDFLKKYKIYES